MREQVISMILLVVAPTCKAYVCVYMCIYIYVYTYFSTHADAYSPHKLGSFPYSHELITIRMFVATSVALAADPSDPYQTISFFMFPLSV